MMNIGRRPTFDEMDVTVEVHLFDFEGNLYGERLSVQFLQRLRDEQKFDSPEALAMQLSEDERHCRTIVEDLGESL
jgi:riboflavin kinase/FMN adenylyltransferase